MLQILSVLVVFVAVAVVPRLRLQGGVHPAALGWMSERWLVEHRASQFAAGGNS